MNTFYKKFALAACIVSAVFMFGSFSAPRYAFAQGSATSALNVPVGTGSDFQSIMNYLMNFTLNKIAYMVAKQILHQMTVSIVNWINTGFSGNPSFLNNPSGFFLDAADQVTGNFIAGSLKNLCSPFSLDIRLALATQQANGTGRGTTCTLSRIIQAQSLASQRAGSIVNISSTNTKGGATLGQFIDGSALNNSNQLSINGKSYNSVSHDFYDNFSQDGGWQGWIDMTTEPQNNMYGAYLVAESDLSQQLAAKKAAIDSDLNRGNGFLSWQDCKSVTPAQAQNALNAEGNKRGAQQVGVLQKNANNQAIDNFVQSGSSATYGIGNLSGQNTGLNQALNTPTTQNLNVGNGTTIQSNVDGNGNVSYQDCQTQTPGSVLSGLTNKAIQDPLVEAELANDINSVLNALVSEMVNMTLTQGLGALSGGGSGGHGHKSYTQQVIDDIQNQNNGIAANANRQIKNQLISSGPALQSFKAIYDQAVDEVTSSKNGLLAVEACISGKMASSSSLTQTQTNFGRSEISQVDSYIKLNIDPLLADLMGKQGAAADQIQQLLNATTTPFTVSVDDSTAGYQAQIDQVQEQVDQAQGVTNISISANATVAKGMALANKDLTDAEKRIKKEFDKVTEVHQSICDGFPANVSGATF